MTTPTAPVIQDAALSASLNHLLSLGAVWKPAKDVGGVKVHTLADVRYRDESPMQSLDLYFPDEALEKTSPLRPVYIHIHGGGWSRGGKASPFYGGPAMCQNATAFGCIAVAPGYRLGKYPEFVHDAADAIKWVKDNIESLGGDLSNIFLSGHSAGSHIASLLILRHACFLAPLGIPLDFFRGLVLVSGVYDLFSPLRSAPVDAKNKWFVLAYVMPAFGTDEKLRREASPLLLLEPEKDTSILGTVVRGISRRYSSSKKLELTRKISQEIEETFKLNTSSIPNVLMFNASFDMGLQENGELMAAALSKYTDVKYVLITGADHASICWNEKTAKEVSEFVQANTVNGSANVIAVETKGRKRRGKREKMPMHHDESFEL